MIRRHACWSPLARRCAPATPHTAKYPSPFKQPARASTPPSPSKKCASSAPPRTSASRCTPPCGTTSCRPVRRPSCAISPLQSFPENWRGVISTYPILRRSIRPRKKPCARRRIPNTVALRPSVAGRHPSVTGHSRPNVCNPINSPSYTRVWEQPKKTLGYMREWLMKLGSRPNCGAHSEPHRTSFCPQRPRSEAQSERDLLTKSWLSLRQAQFEGKRLGAVLPDRE